MKKTKGLVPVVISILLLSVCVAVVSEMQNGKNITANADTSEIVSAEKNSETSDNNKVQTDNEMRGIWIPYMSLQLSAGERTESGFKEKIDGIIERCIKYKANTIIVQVRPFGDSIYPSEFFPWSHIISGVQGKSVDFDPLKYIVTRAHEKNLSVHAWVNPFRISTGKTPSSLSGDNPYIQWKSDDNPDNDSYTFEYEGGIYYNPAYSEVRKLIIDGIAEIVSNYDIDGIQLDDYFYPSDNSDYDNESYEEYVKTVKEGFIAVSQSEWRKNNVNALVFGIHSKIHSIKENVVFGIAPQCNFDNNEKIGADIKNWCSYSGYIDYICPQLYVSNQHPTFPFKELADKWKETVKNSDIKLYFGLGVYKAGTDADSGTWLLSDDNLKTQIEYGRNINTDGFILYSYEYLETDTSEKEVRNAVAVIE